MSHQENDNRNSSSDYDLATNAAGGGTGTGTDAAYDTAGTGGEGTSTGPATHYESGHPAAATAREGDAATLAGSSTNFKTAVDPDSDHAVPVSEMTDIDPNQASGRPPRDSTGT